jgi:membrane-associated protease RseP (regulator of RpoE activity)
MKRIFALAGFVLLASGCAAQKAEEAAGDACAQQGKRAFLAEVRQVGMSAIVVSEHARYLCVSPEEVAHLPAPFDAEVLMVSNLGGVGILSVAPGSVADRAGLEANDVVQAFGGTPVARAADLQSAISQVSPGGEAILKVRRAGQDRTLTARF